MQLHCTAFYHPGGYASAGVLTALIPSGPALAEHCILTAKLDPKRDIRAEPLSAEEQAALLEGVRGMEQWFEDSDAQPPPGYIFYKPAGRTELLSLADKDWMCSLKTCIAGACMHMGISKWIGQRPVHCTQCPQCPIGFATRQVFVCTDCFWGVD